MAAEATTAEQARHLAERLSPAFIIADLVMGGRDGCELIEDLSAICPMAGIIVYSSHAEATHAAAARKAGAHRYVGKACDLEDVARALDMLASGNSFSTAIDRSKPSKGGLSSREFQVLRLIGEGAGLQVTARDLSLSVKTVGTYRERLKMKLGLDSQQALVGYAKTAVLKGRLM